MRWTTVFALGVFPAAAAAPLLLSACGDAGAAPAQPVDFPHAPHTENQIDCAFCHEFSDGWAAAGCPGWGWQDVEPAFARSARGAFPLAELPDRHVLAEAFVHSAQAAGIPPTADLNGEANDGVGFVPVSQRRGRRFTTLAAGLLPSLMSLSCSKSVIAGLVPPARAESLLRTASLSASAGEGPALQ